MAAERLKLVGQSALVAACMLASMMFAKTDPAQAWISCTGNTHYHYNYYIPTKHVNTGKIIYDGGRRKVWEIKKDWDKNGSFQHVEYQSVSCEVW
jgi:hypothetical protein